MNTSRRRFLATSALAVPAVMATANTGMPQKTTFIHHVFFWLNNPGSKEDKAKLAAGLKKLSKVKTIRSFHIGQPAPTDRTVVDSSYAISWMVVFKNKADQDSYQQDPVHLDFIKECSSLWSKVLVYDAEDVVV